MSLAFSEDCATLRVRDGGKGFDVKGPQRVESFGLLTMRERVQSLGGRFRVTSTPGAGTEIEVNVPIVKGPIDEKQER